MEKVGLEYEDEGVVVILKEGDYSSQREVYFQEGGRVQHLVSPALPVLGETKELGEDTRLAVTLDLGARVLAVVLSEVKLAVAVAGVTASGGELLPGLGEVL